MQSSSEINFDSMFPDKKSIQNYVNGNNSLSITDEQGDTLLMFVCFKEYSDIALQMLKKGPNALKLTNQNKNGQTALAIACILNLKNVILFMLDFGPDEIFLNSRDSFNDTPIMEAIKEVKDNDSMKEVIEKILDFGPDKLDLTIVNNKNYTALMIACEYNLPDICLKMMDSYYRLFFDLNLFQENDEGETALDIALRNNLHEISDLISERMREEESYQMDIPSNRNVEPEPLKPVFNEGKVPALSFQDLKKYQQNNSFTIDIENDGFDPFLMDLQKISSYLNEDLKDNIAIKSNNNVYLSKRSILSQQKIEATVFECLEAVKDPSKIVLNLPLFNIKKIGINLSSDSAVGIEAEYIYMDGIDKIINNSTSTSIQDNLFSILALTNKIVVSVISLEEVQVIYNNYSGTNPLAFSAASSLHCQAGQGGLIGIIVSATSSVSSKGGFYKNKFNKSIKKRKNSKKKNLKKSISKKNKTKLRKRK